MSQKEDASCSGINNIGPVHVPHCSLLLHLIRGSMSLIPNHLFSCPAGQPSFLLRVLFALGSYLLSIFAPCTHLMYGYTHVFIHCLTHSTEGSRKNIQTDSEK